MANGYELFRSLSSGEPRLVVVVAIFGSDNLRG